VVAGAGRILYYALFSALRERKANLHRLMKFITAPTVAPTTQRLLCGLTDEEKYKKAAACVSFPGQRSFVQYGEIAIIFGVSELKYDAKPASDAEPLSRSASPTGKLASFALAEQYKQEADYDKAVGLYRTLVANPAISLIISS